MATMIDIPECVVCLNPFDQSQHYPRVLHCGHSVCQECLAQLAPPPDTTSLASCSGGEASRRPQSLLSHTCGGAGQTGTTLAGSTDVAPGRSEEGLSRTGGESSSRPFGGAGSAFQGSLIRCPECSLRTRLSGKGVIGLPKNIELMRLVDALVGKGTLKARQPRQSAASQSAACRCRELGGAQKLGPFPAAGQRLKPGEHDPEPSGSFNPEPAQASQSAASTPSVADGFSSQGRQLARGHEPQPKDLNPEPSGRGNPKPSGIDCQELNGSQGSSREDNLQACSQDGSGLSVEDGLSADREALTGSGPRTGEPSAAGTGAGVGEYERKEAGQGPCREPIRTLEGHRDHVSALLVAGGRLFSASFDKTVRVWSIQTGSLLHTLEGHAHRVMALAAARAGQWVISGDYGAGISVWDVGTTAKDAPGGGGRRSGGGGGADDGDRQLASQPVATWQEHSDWRYFGVVAMAASEEGRLYTGGGSRLVKAWSLEDFSLVATMEGHKGPVSALLLDDEILYSGSWDGTIRLWWLADHSPLFVLSDGPGGTVTGVRSLALIGGGDSLCCGREDGSIQVWRDRKCEVAVSAHRQVASALVADHNWLYSGGWDCCIQARRDGGSLEIEAAMVVEAHEGPVTALAMADGRLVSASGDGKIKVWASAPTDAAGSLIACKATSEIM